MPRLIDADALKIAFHKEWDEVLVWDESGETTADEFCSIVDSMPSADAVEVVHAHWEQDSDGTLYCSKCGRPTYDSHDVPIEFNGAKGLALVWPYYCGFCGAKMDGGDKNAIS